ncbi:MAG TPA: hypothetical protein VKV05_05000 [Terriglobales bacterium]|nr:hypothetical protein [Terriglobales bacterium]
MPQTPRTFVVPAEAGERVLSDNRLRVFLAGARGAVSRKFAAPNAPSLYRNGAAAATPAQAMQA